MVNVIKSISYIFSACLLIASTCFAASNNGLCPSATRVQAWLQNPAHWENIGSDQCSNKNDVAHRFFLNGAGIQTTVDNNPVIVSLQTKTQLCTSASNYAQVSISNINLEDSHPVSSNLYFCAYRYTATINNNANLETVYLQVKKQD